MSRIIRCEKCNTKVADVRDGSLMKGMAVYCGKCHGNLKAKIASARYYAETKGRNPMSDLFGGIFK